MIHSYTFVELDKAIHDRDSFDCSEPELNFFLQNHAVRHMQAGVSRTMVLTGVHPLPNQKLPICAFYCITLSTLRRDTLPQACAKKLPHYPVPVFLLAQLAVHKKYQGRGMGRATLIQALRYFRQINDHMPAYAVTVDCLTEEIKQFYTKYGFESVLALQNGRTRMFLPMSDLKLLLKDVPPIRFSR